MTVAATARLEVWMRPDSKARLERAADLVRVPVSDVVRSAAEDRAEQVRREHQTQTTVPAEFFDDLLAPLDATTQPNHALARAATRAVTSPADWWPPGPSRSTPYITIPVLSIPASRPWLRGCGSTPRALRAAQWPDPASGSTRMATRMLSSAPTA